MAPPKPTIADYDDQSADDVIQRLRRLSQTDLAKLEDSERQGQARRTVLEAIASLRGPEPWPRYDDMEVEEIHAALRERDGDAASGAGLRAPAQGAHHGRRLRGAQTRGHVGA